MSSILTMIFKYLPLLIQAITAGDMLLGKYKEVIDKSRAENRPISDEEMAEITALRKAATASWVNDLA